MLLTGRESGAWGAPGVAQQLLDGVAPEQLAHLGLRKLHAARIGVQRWGGGLPQYAVGHVDRVASIRADVARLPGIEVAGAVYDGVGIPAVVASATRAARATVQHLSSTASRTGEHPA